MIGRYWIRSSCFQCSLFEVRIVKIGTWKLYLIGTCNGIFGDNGTWNLTIDFNFCQYWLWEFIWICVLDYLKTDVNIDNIQLNTDFQIVSKGEGYMPFKSATPFLPQNYVLFLPTSLIRTTSLNLSTCQQSSEASTQAPHVRRLFFQVLQFSLLLIRLRFAKIAILLRRYNFQLFSCFDSWNLQPRQPET